MHTDYCFNYSIVAHDADESLVYSANHAEVASLQAKSILFEESKPTKEILKPLVKNENTKIRISSLRTRKDHLWITMFNLNDEEETTNLDLPANFTECNHIQLDGKLKNSIQIVKGKCKVIFDPFEIKILKIK